MHLFWQLVRIFGELAHIFGELVHVFARKLISRTPSKRVSENLGGGQSGNRGFTMILTFESFSSPSGVTLTKVGEGTFGSPCGHLYNFLLF